MMMKRALFLAASALVTLNAHALSAGDLAFTGFNADKDEWSLVALANIPANTTIYFNDNEWTGSAFNNNSEHGLKWVTGAAAINAGTVVRFTEIDAAVDTIQASVGTLTTQSGAGTNLGLNQDSDELFAFLGTSITAPTTFLTAVSNGGFDGVSFTGTGLTVGINALSLTNSTDFGQYTGARSGELSFSAYAAKINNNANWTNVVGGNNAASTISTAPFSITPVPEPSSTGLLLGGLVVAGGIVQRRRKAA